jgi:uncharacterized membrane protein
MKKLYTVAALLSLVGLADALYLTIEHVTGQSVRCTIISGCSAVLSSPYAVVAGIPLAAVGAAAYFTVFSLAILTLFGYPRAAILVRAMVITMFAISVWLMYLQAFVIREFCQYCLLSALITTALLVVTVIVPRLVQGAASV